MATKSIKLIEISLSRIQETLLPYHEQLLEEERRIFKETLKDESSEVNQIRLNEIERIEQIQSQLENVLFELTEMTRQVRPEDLPKFEKLVDPIRKSIHEFIPEYSSLKTQLEDKLDKKEDVNSDRDSVYEQEQIMANGLIITHEAKVRRDMENVERRAENITGLFTDLSKIVSEQGEHINTIESNSCEIEENVEEGFKQLVKCSRYKRKLYPMTGAVIGTVCGGPVGLLAGLKMGMGVALGCGVLGYTGGKLMHHCDESVASQYDNTDKKES